MTCEHLGPFDVGAMPCTNPNPHGGAHTYMAAWAADPKHGDETGDAQ